MRFKKNTENKENWKWIGVEMTLLESPMSTRHVKHPTDLHFKLFIRQIRWCHDGVFIDTNCGQLFLTGGDETRTLKCYYGKNRSGRHYLSLMSWDTFAKWKHLRYPDYLCDGDECYDEDHLCPECTKKFKKEYFQYLKDEEEGDFVIHLREFDGNRPWVDKNKKEKK